MTYAGLTISDKPALLDAKSKGYDSAYLNFDGYPERVMVDLALAQIEEMESAEIHHKMLPSGMEPITMTNDLSREICENYTDPIAPKTNKSVLLERWAKDTRELAKLLVDSRYDAIIRAYTMQDGSLCWEYDHALEAEIAYLNSAAEGANQ